MKEQKKFYKENELEIATIVPTYQEAFSGWPWYEVSKCVDTELKQRCMRGLSKTALGQTCTVCGLQPIEPAYNPDELIERFTSLEATRPTRWYVESVDDRPALVALAWQAEPVVIGAEKYADVPEMQTWLNDTLPDKPIIWLDEVFADKNVRKSGNLSNFKNMCAGFMSELDSDALAYRTISPAMIKVAKNNFNAFPDSNVPDERSFIRIGESAS